MGAFDFTRLTRKQILLVAILAPIAIVLGWWLPGRINVVISDSISHRIFFLSAPPAEFKTGDYLVFKYGKDFKVVEQSLAGHRWFTKQVGCRPGDFLTVDDDRRFSCNGKPLGQALMTDSRGEALPLFVFNGVTPPDNYFVIGSNPRSFDSKYFGFIKKNGILFKAYPIW
jgi:conjugal transfer pilin signal peptidase TrbI